MNNLEELLSVLQLKINNYRTAKQNLQLIRTHLHPYRQSQHLQQPFTALVQNTMHNMKVQATDTVIAVANYCNKLLERQTQAHQEEVDQLRTEIARQYKLITLMRKELQDLMEMMNQRNNQEETANCRNEEPQEYSQSGEAGSYTAQNTINGLEVIQEEETERTLMSSVHSCSSQAKHKDNFIRIQEKSRYSSQEQSVLQNQSEPIDIQEHRNATNNSEDNEWPSNCKFQGLLDSAASQNIQTELNEEVPSQWDSMPVSVQGAGRGEASWEVAYLSNELKDITNDCEQERQKKTKLFLEEFRKTFNKCLSANVSRKTSKSNQAKPPKDRNRPNSTFGSNVQRSSPVKQNDSQRLINEMLKDIDNNTKFFVGNRKTELKYQGEKKDGVRCGLGVLYYSNGLCYEGNFKNNLRHGFGVLRFNQIQIYRGTWAADELSGQGKIRNFAVINKRKTQGSLSVLSRWVSYCGSFKGNRFEGEGTLYLQGGQKFLGKFICGSACGEGSLFRKSGQVQTGVWRNSELVEQF